MIVQGECRAKLVLAMPNRSQSWASPSESMKSSGAARAEAKFTWICRVVKEQGEAKFAVFVKPDEQ